MLQTMPLPANSFWHLRIRRRKEPSLSVHERSRRALSKPNKRTDHTDHVAPSRLYSRCIQRTRSAFTRGHSGFIALG